jgi:hypothetical protein
MLKVAFYWCITSFFRLCVFIWSRREILGLENVLDTGRQSSNHTNLSTRAWTLVPRTDLMASREAARPRG